MILPDEGDEKAIDRWADWMGWHHDHVIEFRREGLDQAYADFVDSGASRTSEFDERSVLRALAQIDPRHLRHIREIAAGKYNFDEYGTTSWLTTVVILRLLFVWLVTRI